MQNLLKNEKSLYLKQHENNPVYWHPWNKETLEKAKSQRKPIFLSVGYASCHWCHVMAHESFENQDIANLMNKKFINIKVDREERPDVDYIFQKSLSILTGTQGGWPLSMFLDENGVPFTGGTYFPPKEMQGRPDFKKVLNNVSSVYEENREKIIAQAPQMKKIFLNINQKSSVLNQSLEPFIEKILPHLDSKNGSFKGAPKFPQFYMFDTMFYFYLKTDNIKYFVPVEKLLANISSKGIYDQIKGGIARYSVDDSWNIPHFEKMLYDNIQFINLLSQFYQKTKKKYFKEKLKQTISFINDEFKNNESLFGSAYDADSDGIEGKYYIWSYKELKDILKNDFSIFKKKYNISQEGNFEGNNILFENKNFELDEYEKNKIFKIEKILNEIRSKRTKPFFDEKIQTDLNSFAIDILTQASIVLDDNNLKIKTFNTFKKLKDKLNNNIYHCYENSEINAFLEDYVYYSKLLLTLYEVNNDTKSLDTCINLMQETWQKFYNKDSQLLQKNKINKNDLFAEPIDLNDNNIPNGNSVYLTLCNKLYTITNSKVWFDKIEILKKSFNQMVNANFSQMFSFIKSLDIINENISFTFYGKNKDINDIIINLQKNFLGRATFIYRENAKESGSLVICKNQICSKKIDNYDDMEKYFLNNSIR